MLRLERVSKFYSANGLVSTGFSKVDLTFESGEFVAITGESGSGKSTLLNVISGLDSFEEGEMYMMDQPTSGFSKEELEEYRKKYIGNIFQTFNLINSYTVYQNVELVLLLSGYNKTEIPQKVKEIIAKVGLSAYEKTKASKLSGGQKQRVAIARALAKETPIIVADEPTGNLDSKSAAEVIQLLNQLSKDKLIIIVTHNYDQVEPYVTRKITMHDGRVAEDKRLKDRRNQNEAWPKEIVSQGAEKQQTGQERPQAAAEKAPETVKTARADALSAGDMVRLGLRNTFNIPAKFFLLLVVFIFLCAGVIGQYATVMNMNDLVTSQGYNQYFNNTDGERILVSKKDNTPFNDSDYNKLQTVANVDRIVKNDLMLDLVVVLQDNIGNSEYFTITQVEELAPYKDRLEEGRLPKNSSEAILMLPKEGYAAGSIDSMMKKKAWTTDYNNESKILDQKLDIVGYGFLTEEEEKGLARESMHYEAFLCVGTETMNDFREAVLKKSCTQEIHFEDNILSISPEEGYSRLVISDKVPEGEIYLPEEIGSLAQSGAVGKNLKLVNKSLYFEDARDFKVGAVYNKENLNYYLGQNNFDEISGSIFISPKDADKMFSKGNFQSSVMIKDEKLAKATQKDIEQLGYKAFHVKDGLVSYSGGFEVIATTMYTIMLAGVVLVLFFITYFITKLILKSRNVYFSTIRMLGATKKNCSDLLKTELFAVGNIAYFICLLFALLMKGGVIRAGTLNQMMTYLSAGDFVILYIVMGLMYVLLAVRYARQLFRQTAMNAYKEEV